MDIDPPQPPPQPIIGQTSSVAPVSHPATEAPQTAVPPHPLQNEQQQQPAPPLPASVSPQHVGSSSVNQGGIKRNGSEVPWPATALTPGPSTPAPQQQSSSQEQILSQEAQAKPGTPGPPPTDQSGSSSPSGSYRPLNVKDALSYLEMVKIKFQERPDVYNQFLDIMKDFKSQTIDTPGVIERVSSLFTGHPALIQGFNTFLPQGYRIDCSVEDDNQNTITVTTPTGTHTQTSDGIIQRTSRAPLGTPVATPSVNGLNMYFGAPGTPSSALHLATNGSFSGHPQGPAGQPFNDPVPPPGTPLPPSMHLAPQPSVHRAHSPHPIHSPHPTTPGVATLLGGLQGGQPHHHQQHPHQHQHPSHSNAPSPMPQDSKRPVEFNHAINYVNKIKNRFASDPDTYKQFLEILQTYQKEQRPISSVYEQVAVLFNGSVDLLDEFKQFLPDNSQSGAMEGGVPGALMGMIGQMASGTPSAGTANLPDRNKDKAKDRRGAGSSNAGGASAASNGADKANTAAARRKKRAAEKEPPPPPAPTPSASTSRPTNGISSHAAATNGVGPSKAKKAKHTHNKNDAPSPPYSPAHPNAVTDEAVFFDRVKKFIDDRTIYNEFLKLLHLFTEEIIDIRTLIDRAGSFLGGSESELMGVFKEVLGWDERVIVDGEMGPYGPVMSSVRGTVAVVPTMERPKVDLNTCKKYGPSYRKLPKHEALLACSGRDAMCWEVLNDEWVSHPTWASEDAGFSTHKKNMYEDAMHKSEEERHEYDFHIEAITRTISVLEPLNNRIAHMDADERAAWKLKPGLGGQGKSIYQRIIKKVYGREHGLDVITALHESPIVAIPVILSRLKQKEEEWKRAQREWNKVWREVDARNFYKSLDHQGINFKVNDKKSVNPKQLVQDIETRRREVDQERAKSIDPAYARTIPKYHFAYEVRDVAVLQDCLKLVFSFLDRAPPNSAMAQDANQIETFLKTFIPLFFFLDEEEFSAPFASVQPPPAVHGDEVPESDGDDAMAIEEDPPASVASSNGKKKRGGDLRKKVLKGAAAAGGKKGGGGAAAGAAGGKKSASSSRFASPAPQPTLPGDAMQIDDNNDGEDKGKGKATGNRVQDNVWIRHGRQDDDLANQTTASSSSSLRKTPSTRKGTFFANNTFYVLLRNIQLLYARLHAVKKHALELAAAPSPSTRSAQLAETSAAPIPGQVEHRPVPHAYLANPLAVSLGLADATGPGASRLIPAGPNPAGQFYEHTLECCEQLFDGEMDQATFEDHLRFMFGIRSYHLFTVDKVVGSIIKQVQAVLSDVKNKELLTLLRRERTGAVAYTVQEQINARRTAEHMIGPDENMYRITWVPADKVMQIQLLAKDDASTDDAETLTERWKQYMASYVLRHQTEGLNATVPPPLLARTLLQIKPDQPEESNDGEDGAEKTVNGINAPPKTKRTAPDTTLLNFRYGSRSGVEIKVCIRTYRIFFESGGEDLFYRKRSRAEEQVLVTKNTEREVERKDRMRAWLDSKQIVEKAEDTEEPKGVMDGGEKVEKSAEPVEDVEMAAEA